MVSGTAVVVGVGIGATVIVGGGVIYVYTGDKPIKEGSAMTWPRPTPPKDPHEVPTADKVAGGEFVLVDTKQDISVNRDKWEVNGKGGSATIVFSSGTFAEYIWTVPPRIGPSGADISYTAKTTAGKGTRLNATVGIGGEGLQFDVDRNDRGVSVTAEANESKSDSKTVHVKAPASASQVVLIVSVGYDVSVKYTYLR